MYKLKRYLLDNLSVESPVTRFYTPLTENFLAIQLRVQTVQDSGSWLEASIKIIPNTLGGL